MRMYLFEAIIVFTAGVIIGRGCRKSKEKKADEEPQKTDRKINAEMKNGQIVLTFGEEK